MGNYALGVDFGGVILDYKSVPDELSFSSPNYLQVPPILDVFAALRRLREKKFGNRIFVVSKAMLKTEKRSLRWMDQHDFYNLSGITRDRVYFCRERSDKAGICEKLGITHFVDDKLEVLSYLTTVGVRYLFQPEVDEMRDYLRFLSEVRRVQSWQELLQVELS